MFRDVGLTTSRTWGTYDDDEATAIDAIVDAVLEPWRNVKIEKHMVEDAMHKVNEAQDAACFLACLLYTSPSPRDATLSRMPSSA